MKAIAHRPKDLEDIRTIANKYPNLDVGRIEEWIKAFGDVLESPDLWDVIKPLLKLKFCNKLANWSGCPLWEAGQ